MSLRLLSLVCCLTALSAVEPVFLADPAPFPLNDAKGGLESMLAYDDVCHLVANDGDGGRWVTAGATAESVRVVDGSPLGIQLFTVLRGTVYGAKIDSASATEKSFDLYRYDAGDNRAERLVHWILPVQDEITTMRVVVVQDHLYALFFTRVSSTTTGYQIIRSDGSQDGTEEIYRARSDFGFGPGFAAAGNHLFFTEVNGNGSEGREPHAIDVRDVEAGPVLLADIKPGDRTSGVDFSDATVVGDRIFFTASGDFTGQRLFVSDGTPAGTKRVPGLPDTGFPPTKFMGTDEELWLLAYSSEHGYEPHRTDGTTSQLVRDINPGSSSSTVGTFYE